MSEWQSMNTAPTDGTHVLLACCWPEGHPFVCTGWFDAEEDDWYQTNEHWTDNHSEPLQPSAWQPLPEPPK